MLIEIQALAAKAGFGTPQRVATGYDGRRLALLLAVLDKRAGLSFAQLDVFLNVVGGVRLQEPAGDLAVAVALASSVYDRALPHDAVFVGEVGLGGEIRPVSQAERRLAEAANMGMTTRVPRRARGAAARAARDSAPSACARSPISSSASSSERDASVTSASSSSRRQRHARWRRGAEAVPLGRGQADAAAQRADFHGAPERGDGRVRAARAATPAIRHPGSSSATWTACSSPSAVARAARVVANGLDDLPDEAQIVLVHDAARPLVGLRTIERVIESVQEGTPAIAGAPGGRHAQVGGRRAGAIARTVDRSALVARADPAGLSARDARRRAQSRRAPSASTATDDAALCERLGHVVRVVHGSERALKVTDAGDFARVEALYAVEE